MLRELAGSPRPTGGDAIAAARERCARELRGMGFAVRAQSFEFSRLPGSFGTPLVGALALVIAAAAAHWGARGARSIPLVATLTGAVALLAGGRWLAKRGVLALPWMRARGVNLEATRGAEAPAVWLCAHLDSKSQPLPTLVRSGGIVLEAIGFLGVLALGTAAALGWPASPVIWASAAVMTLAGAIPVMMSVVGSRSPGALDNASGVAAVMESARQLAEELDVGVLITDGEELGLAGARAWSVTPRRAIVLNCDGVDDFGRVTIMHSARPPSAVLQAARRASSATGIAHRVRRLPAGILTDSVAFSDAGMPSVTFSRGTFRSLARVHSVRDDLSRLRGDGIAETAILMAGVARELVRGRAP